MIITKHDNGLCHLIIPISSPFFKKEAPFFEVSVFYRSQILLPWNHANPRLVDAQLVVEAVIGMLSVGTIRRTKALLTKMKTTAVAFNKYNSD
jgi:hypothetical protein